MRLRLRSCKRDSRWDEEMEMCYYSNDCYGVLLAMMILGATTAMKVLFLRRKTQLQKIGDLGDTVNIPTTNNYLTSSLQARCFDSSKLAAPKATPYWE